MVQITELVFRDGQQSLLATRMRTEDMLPIADEMDQVGFFSMEVWGGATFDVCLRYLAEDPWERLKELRKSMADTSLQMLERGMNLVAYRNYPDDIVKKFIELAHKDGIDVFRIFDALNDLRNMKVPIETVKKVGGHAQASLCYTISPVHTTEYYVETFKRLQAMGCDSLCIKDMSGIMSPSVAYQMVSACKEAGIKVPLCLHSHTISGMAMMTYLKACEAGVDMLDTSMSPLSGGAGHPPTEAMVAALKDTQYATGYDLDLLMDCRKYFQKVWEKYRHLHREQAMQVDPSVVVHQIPGGMISNLIIQLEQFGASGKFYQVLDETRQVREELGWPPLVTPTSQIVGVQSVMNGVFGRYKRVLEETKNYVKGMYGKPPGEISEEMYRTVLGANWRDEVIEVRPADLLKPMYKQRKDELEELGLLKKEEDVLSYAIFPEEAKKFLSGQAKPEFVSAQLPLEQEMQGRRFRVSLNSEKYDVTVRQVRK
jgi:pyruvate carboxylase subunit B